MKKKLLWILCACMLLGGCSNVAGQESSVNGDEKDVQTVTAKKLGAGSEKEIIPVEFTNEYQKAAYFTDQVYELNQENVLVSPLSLDVALGLAYEGASGTTAEELKAYLGIDNYGDWVDQYVSHAESLRTKGGSSRGYSFAYELANSIWVKQDSKLDADYKALVEKKYRASAENVDFTKDAKATADRINAWCDEKTHGMIKKIVSPDAFSEQLQAILMNSVYFESPWREAWTLQEHEFTNLKGEKESREMLSDLLDVYFENEHATAFSKNYYNGFCFIGILPKQEGDFQLSDLDLASLLESRTDNYRVHAIAPKLNYDTTAVNVIDVLKAQGVQQAFDRYNGQFDHMVEKKELYISDIIQKCKIEMDENGTKAAAVTAIFETVTDSYEPPVEKELKKVYLDRPFAFLIYDGTYDKIVFAGKVVE